MLTKYSKALLLLILCILMIQCQEKKPEGLLEEIFQQGSKKFQKVVSKKDKYEIQVMFSPVSIGDNEIIVEDHFFNFRPDDYFYPASTVKMPVAFLALQKIEELRQIGLPVDIHTSLTIDSLRPAQSPVRIDTTASNGYASIGQYIEKIFAVSDNDAYNRLFEFTGPDYINSHLKNKGIFTNSRIVHRVGVSGFSYEENKYTPSVNFLDENKDTVYQESAKYNTGMHLTLVSNTKKGKGYIDNDGKKINEPFDFGQKNFINIKDLQESLKRMIIAETFPEMARYQTNKNDIKFLISSMSKLPKDHAYLKENTEEYYDSYVKFFMFGDSKEPIPDHITILNKVGYAYGYLTDCAFIQDKKNDVSFFLTATIHVNENQIYNDGVYEYEEIGIPWLAELGRLTHNYMVSQNKKN